MSPGEAYPAEAMRFAMGCLSEAMGMFPMNAEIDAPKIVKRKKFLGMF